MYIIFVSIRQQMAWKHAWQVLLPKESTAGSNVAVTLVLIHADVFNERDDVSHVRLQQGYVSCKEEKKGRDISPITAILFS